MELVFHAWDSWEIIHEVYSSTWSSFLFLPSLRSTYHGRAVQQKWNTGKTCSLGHVLTSPSGTLSRPDRTAHRPLWLLPHLLLPHPPSLPPTPVLMHKTDLLPGCDTRVQLAICSLKPLKSFPFSFKIQISCPTPLFCSLFPCSRVLISVSHHVANGPPVSDCLYVCLSLRTCLWRSDNQFLCWSLSSKLHCSPPIQGASPVGSQSILRNDLISFNLIVWILQFTILYSVYCMYIYILIY